MMIVKRALLSELAEKLQTKGLSQLVKFWKAKMNESEEHCQSCPYEQILERKCCCLCLESCLSNTLLRLSLSEDEGDMAYATISSLQVHRLVECRRCSLKRT